MTDQIPGYIVGTRQESPDPIANAIAVEWHKPRKRIQQARELAARGRALINELRAHSYDQSAELVREMVAAIEECA